MNENHIQVGEFLIRTDKILIIPKDGDADQVILNTLRENLAQIEDVKDIEALPGKSGFYVVSFTNVNTFDEFQSFFVALFDHLSDSFTAYPIFIDDEGGNRYPSGRVIVRFNEQQSEKALGDWSDNHNLGVGEPNRYVPKQVAFEAQQQDSQALLEILKRISNDKDLIEKVWPETYSAYSAYKRE